MNGSIFVGLDVHKATISVAVAEGMRIPIYSGRVFRLEAGHRSDLKPATIPK
ncbi:MULTISPECIES: hypothetical protein [Bradyrhizobium]|jgi:hypothetical protein|uniref:hypothetical protein n=1 Tax=Bradyrhizobium sp. USDA 241 TaxID=3377725 RepID=UPI003C70E990